MRYSSSAQLQAAALLALRSRIGITPPVWMPHPDNAPQQAAAASDADELFYGGAAGGGKTSLAVGLALTAHSYSIIYRQQYSQIQGLRDELLKIVPSAKTNWQSNIARYGGKQIEFGALERPGDWRKFAGRAHDYIGIDEIQMICRDNYYGAMGWLRTTVPGQRCRLVATGNPPTTSDGEWIIQEWAPWLDDAFPAAASSGELRWYITRGDRTEWVSGPGVYEADGRTVTARSRTFIPARVDDNPYFADGNYASVLAAMPEEIRLRLLDGDFRRRAESDPWQIIPTDWIEAAMARQSAAGDGGTLNAIGVDVARGGRDKTVIACRRGSTIEPLIKIPGSDTPNGEAVARFVAELLPTDGASAEIGIDVIGIGSSAYDAIVSRELLCTPLAGGGASIGTDAASRRLGFANLRAEWYWRLREALDPCSGAGISLPRDAELKSDLASVRYSLRGLKIAAEKKDDIIRRIGRSPDCGDAVVYCWAIGDNRHGGGKFPAQSLAVSGSAGSAEGISY